MDSKEREKRFKKALKDEAKKLKVQTKMGFYFNHYKDYFISISPSLNGLTSAVFKTAVKPYEADRLSWQVMGMEENLLEPDSLQAVGAFALRPYPISEEGITYENYEELEEETKRALAKEVKHAEKFLDQFSSVADFIRYTNEYPHVLYKNQLVEILWQIKEGQLEEAKAQAQELIEKKDRGPFSNNGKTIYEHIRNFDGL